MARLFGGSDKITEASEIITLLRGDLQSAIGGGGGSTHNVLSITHVDTATQGVTRGSIIYGDSTPLWNELTKGALSTHLEAGADDISWVSSLTLADGEWVGLGAAAARVEFSSAGNAVSLYSAADLIVYSDAGSTEVARIDGATGNITTSGTVDGVDVANFNAAQFVTLAATAYAANEQVLESYAPTWTAVHIHQNTVSFDDGSGDSPALQFIGGSNNDTAMIFLDNDATITDSDLVIKLCDTSAHSKLIIQDSGGAGVAAFSSDGWLAIGHTTTSNSILEVVRTTNPDVIIRNSTEEVDEVSTLNFLTGSGALGNANILGQIHARCTQATASTLKSSMEFRINTGDLSSEVLKLDSQGYVGIGMEGAGLGSALHVRGSQLRWDSSATAADPGIMFLAGATYSEIRTGRVDDYASATIELGINTHGANIGFGTGTPGSLTEWNMATENIEFVDVGSDGATQQDWIQVEIGGNTGYIHVYAAV